MAETAKILNPQKKVLLPDLDAGCSLSDSCPAGQLEDYKNKNPETYVVAYVNCSADVKALSDVICTSGNAVQIVNQIPADKEILFVPDQNLGQWVTAQTGRQMKLWPGSCYAHVLFTKESIERCRLEFPMLRLWLTLNVSNLFGILLTKYAALKRWLHSVKTIRLRLLLF